MGRGIQKWSEKTIRRLEEEGRGRGSFATYKPWFFVGDFASRGRTHTPISSKTGERPHQLFSDNEFNFFLILEWASDVIDIREQFPLSRIHTQEIAMELGIPHPYYPGTHVPTVMTVDFMATRVREGTEFLEAFNIKAASEAEDERSMEKLEIQRETLERMGIVHHLVFDTCIPASKVKNLAWIRGGCLRTSEQAPYPGFFEEQMAAMAFDLAESNFNGTLAQYCTKFDSTRGIASGTGLRVARMLLASRVLQVELNTPGLAQEHISAFRVTDKSSQ